MNNISFANDVIIGLASNPTSPPVAPSLDLTAVARMIDGLLISELELAAYRRDVFPRLGKLHPTAVRMTAVGNALSDDELVDRLAYLRPLTAEQEAFVLERPLSGRSDRELRDFRVDLLAVNLGALVGLQAEILDVGPAAWLDLMAEEGDRLRRRAGELPTDWINVARAIGLDVPETDDIEAELAMERGGDFGDDRDAAELDDAADQAAAATGPSEGLGPIFRAVPVDRLEWRRGRESVGSNDRLTLDIDRRDVLIAKSGGIGFVEEGCTLTLRLLDHHDNLLATGVATGQDVPVVLTGPNVPGPLQKLQVEFVRTVVPERHFVVSVDL